MHLARRGRRRPARVGRAVLAGRLVRNLLGKLVELGVLDWGLAIVDFLDERHCAFEASSSRTGAGHGRTQARLATMAAAERCG